MFARHFVHVRDVLFEFWLLHVAITCATRYKQWNLFCSELFEKQFLGIWNYSFISLNHHFTQLFEDRLALVNPRLNCNPGFYFFFWRVFSRIIFSILFRAIHSYIVDWHNQLNWILLFTLSYLNSNVELTLGYLKPALKNPADSSSEHIGRCAVDGTVSAGNARKTSKILTRKNWTITERIRLNPPRLFISYFLQVFYTIGSVKIVAHSNKGVFVTTQAYFQASVYVITSHCIKWSEPFLKAACIQIVIHFYIRK